MFLLLAPWSGKVNERGTFREPPARAIGREIRESSLFSIVSGAVGSVKFLPCVDLRSWAICSVGLPCRVVKTGTSGRGAREVDHRRGPQFGQSGDEGLQHFVGMCRRKADA